MFARQMCHAQNGSAASRIYNFRLQILIFAEPTRNTHAQHHHKMIHWIFHSRSVHFLCPRQNYSTMRLSESHQYWYSIQSHVAIQMLEMKCSHSNV